jgi:drug/metabolite transporter (DMT)-like permease
MTQASWKNRRRMAWLSFAGIMVMVLGATYRLMFVGDDPNNWTGIVSILVSVLGAIVVGYSGFATWSEIKKPEEPK